MLKISYPGEVTFGKRSGHSIYTDDETQVTQTARLVTLRLEYLASQHPVKYLQSFLSFEYIVETEELREVASNGYRPVHRVKEPMLRRRVRENNLLEVTRALTHNNIDFTIEQDPYLNDHLFIPC